MQTTRKSEPPQLSDFYVRHEPLRTYARREKKDKHPSAYVVNTERCVRYHTDCGKQGASPPPGHLYVIRCSNIGRQMGPDKGVRREYVDS